MKTNLTDSQAFQNYPWISFKLIFWIQTKLFSHRWHRFSQIHTYTFNWAFKNWKNMQSQICVNRCNLWETNLLIYNLDLVSWTNIQCFGRMCVLIKNSQD